MAKKKVFVVSSIIIACLIAAAVVAYEIIMPEIIARRYISNLESSAQQLRTSFEELAGSTDTPILNDPAAPADERKAGVKHLQRVIGESRENLADLVDASATLQPLPYSGYFGTYPKALVLRERASHIRIQTDSALRDLDGLRAYLETYATATGESTKIIDTFNQTTDLNTLLGRSQEVRESARQLRAHKTTLASAQAPSDLTKLKDSTINSLEKVAVGFDHLAQAVSVADDAAINAAAKEIEAAGAQLETIRQESYIAAIQQSRTIRSIHELNEKLDLILP